MPKQDIKRDYAEIVAFAQAYIGCPAIDCIEAYAQKRRIVWHRAGRAFWDKVDDGEIKVGPIGTTRIMRIDSVNPQPITREGDR